MKKRKYIAGLLAIVFVISSLTSLGSPIDVAASNSKYTVKKTAIDVSGASNSKGYGILRKTNSDGVNYRGLVDPEGNLIFGYEAEYATWGGYTVLDNDIVKIGDETYSLFYDIKNKTYFDAFLWAYEFCEAKWSNQYSYISMNYCRPGNSTVVINMICYIEEDSDKYATFDNWNLVFDLSGNIISYNYGGWDTGDTSCSYTSVAEDVAIRELPGLGGLILENFVTGESSILRQEDYWPEEKDHFSDLSKLNMNWTLWKSSDGYMPLRDNETYLYGFTDNRGDITISPQYEQFGYFENGYAAEAKNGKYGYIDKANNVVIPFEYDGAYGANAGYFTVVKNQKCGVVDAANKVVVPFEYEDISGLSKGVAYAVKNGKLQIIQIGQADKLSSSITLKDKSAVYTGKAISIGKAKVKGSTGKVTYTYYTDKNCKNKTTKSDGASKAGAAPKKIGTYYVKAKVAADANYKSKTSSVAKLTITSAAKVTANK